MNNPQMTQMNADGSPLQKRIAGALVGRYGPERAVSSHWLAKELGVNEREIRRVIAEEYKAFARTGMMIVSKCGNGFYLATEAEQLAEMRLTLKRIELAAKARVQDFDAVMREAGLNLPKLEEEVAA